jgi:hypothetical protein
VELSQPPRRLQVTRPLAQLHRRRFSAFNVDFEVVRSKLTPDSAVVFAITQSLAGLGKFLINGPASMRICCPVM